MKTLILPQGNSGHRHDWYRNIVKFTKNKTLSYIETNSFFDERKYFFLALMMLRAMLLRQTIALYFSWSNILSPNKYSLKRAEYCSFYLVTFFLNIKLIAPFLHKSKRFLTDLNFFDLSDVKLTIAEREKFTLGFFGSALEVKQFKKFLGFAQKIASNDRKILIHTKTALDAEELCVINANPFIYLKNEFADKQDFLKSISSVKAIWCVYSKYYDQSSGLVGHATQLGKLALVREGSIISRMNSKNIIQISDANYQKELSSLLIDGIFPIAPNSNMLPIDCKRCESSWFPAFTQF